MAPHPGAVAGRTAHVGWNIGDHTIEVRVVPYRRSLQLPGIEIPGDSLSAFAFSFAEGSVAVAFALPSLWRARTASQVCDLAGALIHEWTHAVHWAAVSAHLNDLRDQHAAVLSALHLDDDIIETRFGHDPRFADSIAMETELFYAAALEHDPEERRANALLALALMDARREEHYTGARAVFAELESTFLGVEGLAEWSRFHAAMVLDPTLGAEVAIERVRGMGQPWSQDQGLALVLLIDRLVPHWQERLLAPDAPAPEELVRAALAN